MGYRKSVIAVLVVLFALIAVPYLWDVASYMYALQLERSWTKAQPQTRQEMESYLSLYSTRSIHPKQSDWGKHFELAANERMIQYRILWNAELDVVYDDTDKLIQIFTSYE